jgi:hypothetical protein
VAMFDADTFKLKRRATWRPILFVLLTPVK